MHLLRPTKREYFPASKSSRGVRRGGGGGGGGFNIENQVRERGCVGAQQKIPIENMGGFRIAHPICTQGTSRSKTTQGG